MTPGEKGGDRVRFLVFVSAFLLFSLIGIAVWRVWSKINLSIRREEEAFKVEKEAFKKMKKKVEENEDE